MIRQPRVTARQWLKTYAAFYERLMARATHFVIATFEDVTTDFGAVIRRVNERFSTDFREFDHTPSNVEMVFALIDERAGGPPWQPAFNRFLSGFTEPRRVPRSRPALHRGSAPKAARAGVEHRVGRPSDVREAAKPAMLRAISGAVVGSAPRAGRARIRFVRRAFGSEVVITRGRDPRAAPIENGERTGASDPDRDHGTRRRRARRRSLRALCSQDERISAGLALRKTRYVRPFLRRLGGFLPLWILLTVATGGSTVERCGRSRGWRPGRGRSRRSRPSPGRGRHLRSRSPVPAGKVAGVRTGADAERALPTMVARLLASVVRRPGRRRGARGAGCGAPAADRRAWPLVPRRGSSAARTRRSSWPGIDGPFAEILEARRGRCADDPSVPYGRDLGRARSPLRC